MAATHETAKLQIRPKLAKGSGDLDGWMVTCEACGFHASTSLSRGEIEREAQDHVDYMLRKEGGDRSASGVLYVIDSTVDVDLAEKARSLAECNICRESGYTQQQSEEYHARHPRSPVL